MTGAPDGLSVNQPADLDSDRGEGANHAIIDVQDFSNIVAPVLGQSCAYAGVRAAMDSYEDAVGKRARPAVFASRQACLDANDWVKVQTGDSPLLSKRAMVLDFPDEVS